MRARLSLGLVAVVVAAPQPSALVLHRSDVGAAFSARGMRISNRDVPRPLRRGRIDGHEVVFTRTTGSLQDGPLQVQSGAGVYRTGSEAHAAIAYSARQLVPAGYVPLQLGFAIGRDARQWVRQGEAGVGTVLQYLLIWREHDVDASIVITGRVGVVSAADVAPLARRQEARIRAALR